MGDSHVRRELVGDFDASQSRARAEVELAAVVLRAEGVGRVVAFIGVVVALRAGCGIGKGHLRAVILVAVRMLRLHQQFDALAAPTGRECAGAIKLVIIVVHAVSGRVVAIQQEGVGFAILVHIHADGQARIVGVLLGVALRIVGDEHILGRFDVREVVICRQLHAKAAPIVGLHPFDAVEQFAVDINGHILLAVNGHVLRANEHIVAVFRVSVHPRGHHGIFAIGGQVGGYLLADQRHAVLVRAHPDGDGIFALQLIHLVQFVQRALFIVVGVGDGTGTLSEYLGKNGNGFNALLHAGRKLVEHVRGHGEGVALHLVLAGSVVDHLHALVHLRSGDLLHQRAKGRDDGAHQRHERILGKQLRELAEGFHALRVHHLLQRQGIGVAQALRAKDELPSVKERVALGGGLVAAQHAQKHRHAVIGVHKLDFRAQAFHVHGLDAIDVDHRIGNRQRVRFGRIGGLLRQCGQGEQQQRQRNGKNSLDTLHVHFLPFSSWYIPSQVE